MYQRKGNTDKNQAEIVKNLRKLGISVETNKDDILVGWINRHGEPQTWWFEIKNEDARSKCTGKVKPSALRPKQRKLLAEWQGQLDVAFTLQDILEVIEWKK